MRYVAWAKVDKVYIPINYDCQHWACGEIDLKAWTFTVYDSSTSFISSTDKFINMMARYQHLPAIINATRYWEVRGDNPNLEPFTLMRCTDVPQQGKASGDCGVFTLLMIEYLATGRKFDYTSSDSITLRRMIAAKIFAHGCTC
ncbi:ubiquitin-like-specific protease 1 [Mangifera indica]|nr:ubiquitin-like-specific protease 1 [Mangifera indica]